MDSACTEIIVQGLRALFLLSIPILAGITIAGVFVGILQSVTTISDPAIGYAVRLIAFLGVLYVMLPAFMQSAIGLFESALKG